MKSKEMTGVKGTFEALDRLEPRVLLDGSAMPDLGMLENPDNTVVRIVTDLGDVDIELFEADAPLATAAFLTQLQGGDFGQTFIHFADDNMLGAGLYSVDGAGELNRRTVTTQIDTTFVRSNVAQTLAMPVLDLLTGESNGSFIINLEDNSATVDGANLVFGQVVQGWENIEAIAAQPREDLSAVFTEVPMAQWLTSVPVTEANASPASIAEAPLVGLETASIIKGAMSEQFFTNRIYYPEGFSWERVYEAVDMLNPGETSLEYQVIVRYETGQRDQTIAMGTLEAGQIDTLVVSERDQASTLVRNGEPYAYEIWSTAPMGANIQHADFGGLGGDAFFNAEAFSNVGGLNEWSFSQVVVDSSESSSFLVWQNLTGEAANLTVTFYYEDQASTTREVTLEAHRRGGFELDALSEIEAGSAIGITVSSDQSIVAGFSQYRVGESKGHGEGGEHGEKKEHGEKGEKKEHGEKGEHGENGEHPEGGELGELGEHGENGEGGEHGENGEGGEHGEKKEHKEKEEHGKGSAILALGTSGGGALSGISSEIEEDKNLTVAILNPSSEDVPITFTIIDEDGKTETVQLVMPADRLTLLEGEQSPLSQLNVHEEFVIRYEADSPLTVGLQAKESKGTGTPFSSWSSEVTYFADSNVYTRNKTSFEKQEVWMYNPGTTAVAPTITLNFADMDPISVTLDVIEPGEWIVQGIEKLKKFFEHNGQSPESHFPNLKELVHSITVEADSPLVVQTAQHERSAAVENGLAGTAIALLTTPSPMP